MADLYGHAPFRIAFFCTKLSIPIFKGALVERPIVSKKVGGRLVHPANE